MSCCLSCLNCSDEELDNANEEIRLYKSQLQQADQVNRYLKDIHSGCASTISDLKKKLMQKDSDIRQLRYEVKNLKEKIRRNENLLSNLECKLEASEESREDLKDSLYEEKRRRGQIERLKAEMEYANYRERAHRDWRIDQLEQAHYQPREQPSIVAVHQTRFVHLPNAHWHFNQTSFSYQSAPEI